MSYNIIKANSLTTTSDEEDLEIKSQIALRKQFYLVIGIQQSIAQDP